MKITYNEDRTIAFCDGLKFRRDAKTGYFLCSKPTFEGKRERLHVYVWRRSNGAIPEGWHVHHKDGDKYHNDLENLMCIDGSSHLSHHQKERAENDRERILENLRKNAIPAASAWHKSEAGREWHRNHWGESLGAKKLETFECQFCGKTFTSYQTRSRFCSNNCRAYSRKESGVDDENRKCVICGKEFICNKYIKKQTCSSECSLKLQKNRKREAVRRGAGLQYGG